MRKNMTLLIGLLLAIPSYPQTPSGNEWDKQVSQAAALIKSDPKAASEAFDDLLKGKNKKNTDLLVDIGQAYLQEGNYRIATEYAERAKELDNKCADAYVLSGDIALAQKDVNKASSDYNQAIYLDDDCCEAYLKYAKVYQGVNPQLSVDMLLSLQKKTPEDTRIHKALGDIYYHMGEYGKAIEAYDDYMDDGTPAVQDYARYAMLLFLNNEYDQSLTVVKKGLAMDVNDLALKRLAMYNYGGLEDYDDGLKAASEFFAIPNESDRVYLDYVYYARLLRGKQRYDEAIVQYQKALDLNELQVDVYREMSDTYEDNGDFSNAILTFKKYLNGLKDPSDVGDMFLYGRLNYYAAADSTETGDQTLYLNEANEAFSKVMEYAPNNYLGSFWCARTNSMLDPETTKGLAKPYYEKALSLLEKKQDSSPALVVECLSYLGYYYFIKEDYPQSKFYWNRILEIDPTNEVAGQALEGMK